MRDSVDRARCGGAGAGAEGAEGDKRGVREGGGPAGTGRNRRNRGGGRGGARAGGGRPAAARAVLAQAALAALALARAGGVLAAGPDAAAGGPVLCASLEKRPCRKSPLCKWGGGGVRVEGCQKTVLCKQGRCRGRCRGRCAVAKDACDAVRGRKRRKKCGRVPTERCQCSLNSIWTSCDSGQSWTERSVRSAAKAWADITSCSEGVLVAAVVDGGGIWTSTDSGQSWTEWTGIEASRTRITSSEDTSAGYISDGPGPPPPPTDLHRSTENQFDPEQNLIAMLLETLTTRSVVSRGCP